MLHLQFVPQKQVTLNTETSFACFSETFLVLQRSDRVCFCCTVAVAVVSEWRFRLKTSTSFWLNPELSSSRSVRDLNAETQLLFGQHTLPRWHGHLIAANNLNRQLNEVFQGPLWWALMLIHNIVNIGCHPSHPERPFTALHRLWAHVLVKDT